MQFFAQKELPIAVNGYDKDLFLDDFGNVYVYKNSDSGIAKFDSLGNKKAQTMLPNPFKIKSVENPLNIFLFSENRQEAKILDQNLNEIQTLNFQNQFGYIKALYFEDLQYVWVLDSSANKLVQYNYRDETIINSFPLKIDFDKPDFVDFVVYNRLIYVLRQSTFEVYDFNSEKLKTISIENGKRLKRDNSTISIITDHKVLRYTFPENPKPVFSTENAMIVDKNHLHYLVMMQDKLYLYEVK